MHVVRLVIEIYAPDELLKQSGLSYYSMEKTISLKFAPFPGLMLRIKPVIEDDKNDKFGNLFRSISNKSGIFEVDQCYADIDSKTKYDLEVKLRGKSETTLENFLAMKEYLEYLGFKKC